jgi:D-alanyl-D-alanine carboxypeptidase
MKNKTLIKNWIRLCLLLLFLVFGVIIITNLPDNQKEEEFVSGDTHIYKGQKLTPDYAVNPIRLSLRASWLSSNQKVDGKIKVILEKMIDDAEKEGVCLVVTSGYRPAEEQQKLYNSAKDKSLVALPYSSEHQTGLAVDFAACPMEDGRRNDEIERPELAFDFNVLPEYRWLRKNASEYGFEESFTESNKKETGYPSEPWHWKYIIK